MRSAPRLERERIRGELIFLRKRVEKLEGLWGSYYDIEVLGKTYRCGVPVPVSPEQEAEATPKRGESHKKERQDGDTYTP